MSGAIPSAKSPGLSAAPYAASVSDVLAGSGTHPTAGLSSDVARARQDQFGANELPSAPPTPHWRKFLRQFQEIVVGMLIVAALISGALGDWLDTAAILAIVLLNGLLGFVQELRAEQALAALAKLSSPEARVWRDGQLQSLPAKDLVPGDLIELDAGDKVPADCRLCRSFSLSTHEASLTGESTPVAKDAAVVLPTPTPLADRTNLAFLGTTVATGKATAVVVATGAETELGRIAGLLRDVEPEPTPLQRRLGELGKTLIVVCLIVVAVIFLLELVRGGQWAEVLLTAVSLAVAAVPEGLPAVVTITLALGLERMVRRHALIRKLPSVETLGAVTVVCSDKTGTLTRNEMTATRAFADDQWFQVSGVGYQPEGSFQPVTAADTAANDSTPTIDIHSQPVLRKLLDVAARCNHAQLLAPQADAPQWRVIGDPTEGALLVLARKAGIDPAHHPWPLVDELPFDSQRKAMSMVFDRDGQRLIYAKGAPEVILSWCTAEQRHAGPQPLADARRQQLLDASASQARRALRMLACAYRPWEADDTPSTMEQRLVFCGLIGLIDPPREEARVAIHLCRQAGVQPVMITGDHPDTAAAIGRELALLEPGARVLTGVELDALDESSLAEQVHAIGVFARVSAEHKLRIVQAWKRRGQVVAMTGDGVNDAPAVHAADIGIAMGITGTDVTKEASDMVLTDDNFASIVNAIEEGRCIYDNIQKFVHYLLTCNTGEVLLMFAAGVAGWPPPLSAIELLWINLVTDGLPALSLAMEPPEKDLMRRPPRPPREPVITRARGLRILVQGSLMAAASLAGFVGFLASDPQRLDLARFAAFNVAAFSQLVFSFSCRSQKLTLPELGLFSNPYLLGAMLVSASLQVAVGLLPFTQRIFHAQPLNATQWFTIVVLALAPVTVVEVGKLARAAWRRRWRHTSRGDSSHPAAK